MIIVVETLSNKVLLTGFGKRGRSSFVWDYGSEPGAKAPALRLDEIVRHLAGRETVETVSFRLRFGGGIFGKPSKIDRAFIDRLSNETEYFPAYIPSVCALLEVFLRGLASVPLLAFFETSLFSGLPMSEKLYPLADEYSNDPSVSKWGYHGIYHGEHAKILGGKKKVVSIVFDHYTTVCALNGSSPCAISLGRTPLGGVMSEKGCGDIDPGIAVYLMKESYYSMHRLDELLKNESGFYGLTGYNLPLPELIKLYGKNDKVTLAFDVYRNQILKYIGDYMAVLEGADAVIFGGRYVNDLGQIIYTLAKDLSFLGVSLRGMPWENGKELYRLTADGSALHFYVNGLDEPEIICRETGGYLPPKTGTGENRKLHRRAA